jgi:hypothetical protein
MFQCATTVAVILKLDLLCAQEKAIYRKRFGKFHHHFPAISRRCGHLPVNRNPMEKFCGIERYQYDRNDTEVIKNFEMDE